MKELFIIFLLGSAVNAGADIFILKDGARIEGDVTGAINDTVLVQTKYGSLTINKADIQEEKTAQPGTAPETTPLYVSSAAPAETAVSTEGAVDVSAFQPEAADEAAPEFTFSTVLSGTGTRRLVYMDNGVVIATETFDASGALASLEGGIINGTYTEYYPDGALKTVKTMQAGKANGTLNAYYPSGKRQVEAYYLAGQKDGQFKYFTESGALLMEASYKNDLLDGWKKEYAPDGAVTSQIYYAEDKPAEPPKAQAAPEEGKTPDSMATGKITILARGERISFHVNNKYVGKIQFDRDFNIIKQSGNLPAGTIKVYSGDAKFSRSYGTKAKGSEAFNWAGKLARELVIQNNEVQLLKIFSYDGSIEKEFVFKSGKAIER